MDKHTPGPWTAVPEKLLISPVSGKETHAAGRLPQVKRSNQVIADVCRTLDARIKDGRDPEAEANARLIAAAPDLLAALIELLAARGHAAGEHTVCDKARAAIAKAEGA